MNYINFISERDYIQSSKIHNHDMIDEDQNNICYLETKYGKNNIHNLIKTNKSYKNKYKNILEQCKLCNDNDYHNYLDNGLNCLTCTNNFLYLSKNEEQYTELINKYILELESLKINLNLENERSEIKKDLKNLYLIKNISLKKALEYFTKYREKVCKNKISLQCHTFNDKITNLIYKINISNIELVYIIMNNNNKDVCEILDILDEYKLTHNSKLFNRIKEIEKENIIIEKFSNFDDNNYILLVLLVLFCFFYTVFT